MRPQLKRVHSPDVDDLGSHLPVDPKRFVVLVQLMVGPAGDGEESFDLVVCTPAWLSEQLEKNVAVDLRHHLLVASWDWEPILQHIESALAEIDEPTWPEVAAVVGRLGRWEFEDSPPARKRNAIS